MESYCSLCTLDTVHRHFVVTRLIINKMNKVQWVDFKLENVLVSLHSLITMGLGSIIFKEWRVTWTFPYTNTTGVASGAGTAYPSGAPEFTTGFKWGSRCPIFSFICMFCRSLFVLLFFFYWSLCCLFFVDLRILIITLLSPKFSQRFHIQILISLNRFHKSELDRADSSLECFILYIMNAGSSQISYGGNQVLPLLSFTGRDNDRRGVYVPRLSQGRLVFSEFKIRGDCLFCYYYYRCTS